MCGYVKHEKRNLKLGNPVPVTNPATGMSGNANWSGFAQNESLAEFWALLLSLLQSELMFNHLMNRVLI